MAKQVKSNPKSAEEWAMFHQKNKEFSEKLSQMTAKKTYIQMTNEEFKNFIADMSDADKRIFIEQMKSTRNFYKRIINEDFYKDHKKGHRYNESLANYNSINEKGKIISQTLKKDQ